MARDANLLRFGIPCLRLYAWERPTVSLGYAQPPGVVDADAAKAEGVDVVRRPTGGGAILHTVSEVTYAVVLPRGHPGLPEDVPGSAAAVSRGVALALEELGATPEIRDAPASEEALCYLRPGGLSVTVGGRKVSGAAQRRTASHVLQHGTVIVDADEARMARLFRVEPARVEAEVASLSRLGIRASRARLHDALVRGFSKALGVEFDRT
ncbi:MAG: lipoate--protein ligase family protein, partial [Methanobacteriota archaeon]